MLSPAHILFFFHTAKLNISSAIYINYRLLFVVVVKISTGDLQKTQDVVSLLHCVNDIQNWKLEEENVQRLID